MTRRLVPLLALAGSLIPTWTAKAEGKRKAPLVEPAPSAGEPAGLSLEEIAIMLSSSNAQEVRTAIESSPLLGSRDVVPMLVERVRAGLPPDLLSTALESLAVLNSPASSELLVSLTHHRRPSVRLRSVQALTALHSVETRGPARVQYQDVEAALVGALGDSSPEVRDAAAEGLGQLGASGALESLFEAFDRGVLSAGSAVGKLVSDGQVPRIMESLGRIPFSSLIPVFDSLLARQDLSENTKLSVLAALSELGTFEARAYLESLRQKLPQDASPRIRKAIDDAVVRIAQ